jgi:hypothetical protein
LNESSNKHAPRSPQGLVTGLVVIAVGVYFLLRNFGIDMPFMYMHNWWALFILIAAIAPLTQAMQAWRARGRFDASVARPGLTALIIVSVALMLLLDVRWDRWWPVFVIYGGLWMLVRDRREDS